MKKITRNKETAMGDRTWMFGDCIETDFSLVFFVKKTFSSWHETELVISAWTSNAAGLARSFLDNNNITSWASTTKHGSKKHYASTPKPPRSNAKKRSQHRSRTRWEKWSASQTSQGELTSPLYTPPVSPCSPLTVTVNLFSQRKDETFFWYIYCLK